MGYYAAGNLPMIIYIYKVFGPAAPSYLSSIVMLLSTEALDERNVC